LRPPSRRPEVVVGEIDGVVLGDDDVVGSAETLAVVRPARQLRARRPVLLEAHHGAVVVGAPDQAPLRVEAGAARPDEQHVRPPLRVCVPAVIDVGAGVARLSMNTDTVLSAAIL
jgi:hypothetical protein